MCIWYTCNLIQLPATPLIELLCTYSPTRVITHLRDLRTLGLKYSHTRTHAHMPCTHTPLTHTLNYMYFYMYTLILARLAANTLAECISICTSEKYFCISMDTFTVDYHYLLCDCVVYNKFNHITFQSHSPRNMHIHN